ncbi:hypothetical protein AB0B68_28560 [Micromonospora sp. NPDC049049]|uniref:hypothetical protein n=1 Tax=Micromonospora sp. NPDC049049 TaxID=3155495 RepID=UPI0033BFEF55
MNTEISIERLEAMPTEHQWITTPVTADLVRGFVDLEATARGLLPHRLTAWARQQIPDDQLAMAEAPRRPHHPGHCGVLEGLGDRLGPEAAGRRRVPLPVHTEPGLAHPWSGQRVQLRGPGNHQGPDDPPPFCY